MLLVTDEIEQIDNEHESEDTVGSKVDVVTEVLYDQASERRLVIDDRCGNIRKFRSKIKDEHAKIDTVCVLAQTFPEDYVVQDKQRHEYRCYVKLNVIHHSSSVALLP